MGRVVIGMDPHKRSATIYVVDEREHVLDQGRFVTEARSGFAEGMLVEHGQAPLLPERELRELYADSLFDLHHLLEEIRFEVAFAVMLLVDSRIAAKWRFRSLHL